MLGDILYLENMPKVLIELNGNLRTKAAPETATAAAGTLSPLSSRKQVAAYVGLHPKTIERMDGLLKPLRINRRVLRYRRENVEAFLTSATV